MTAEAPCLELDLPGDYLQRTSSKQRELMRAFLERLEEILGTLPLDVLYALGFDFARVADLSVLSLLAIEKNMHRREALTIEMRNVPGNEQKLIVGMVMERISTRCVGAAFDATGMGWTVAEDMGRKFGLREGDDSPGMVWAIKFSQDWYRVNMPPLKTAFEEATLSIGRWDAHLGDLRAVKKVRGIPRVPEIREADAKGKKRHGDYAIALALAHFASRMRWVEIAYTPVPNNRQSEPQDGRLGMTAEDQDAMDRPWWKQPLGATIQGGV